MVSSFVSWCVSGFVILTNTQIRCHCFNISFIKVISILQLLISIHWRCLRPGLSAASPRLSSTHGPLHAPGFTLLSLTRLTHSPLNVHPYNVITFLSDSLMATLNDILLSLIQQLFIITQYMFLNCLSQCHQV